MPIKKELRKHYGRHWRKVVRPKILKRAGGKFDSDGRYTGGACCEQCGAEDGKEILRHPDWPGVWFEYPSGIARHRYSRERRRIKYLPADLLIQKRVKVQIGVAHVNNIAGDDRPKNLKAWCRDCHLHHDQHHHHQSRATRKDSARPLFNPDYYNEQEAPHDEIRDTERSPADRSETAAVL